MRSMYMPSIALTYLVTFFHIFEPTLRAQNLFLGVDALRVHQKVSHTRFWSSLTQPPCGKFCAYVKTYRVFKKQLLTKSAVSNESIRVARVSAHGILLTQDFHLITESVLTLDFVSKWLETRSKPLSTSGKEIKNIVCSMVNTICDTDNIMLIIRIKLSSIFMGFEQKYKVSHSRESYTRVNVYPFLVRGHEL